MSLLFLRAYAMLIYFDLFVSRGDFAALHQSVRQFAVRPRKKAHEASVEQVCSTVDVACIWYWKRVLCLQRSAATVCLLRRAGVPAQLVIGAQQIPFKAHAWVEVKGCIVNDKDYTREMYVVLDRC